jgi:hypothetical protein
MNVILPTCTEIKTESCGARENNSAKKINAGGKGDKLWTKTSKKCVGGS